MTVPGNIPAPMMAAAKGPLEVKGTSSGSSSSGSTGHTVTLPNGIVAGELLIVILGVNRGDGISWGGTGFTEFFDVAKGGICELAFAYKKATGSETTISVTTGDENAAWTCYRIANAEDPATQAPEASTGATGTSNTPNPDSITPTGGEKDYLFLAAHVNDDGRTTSVFPSGYSNGLSIESSEGANDCGVASAERLLTASSENPGTFTISSSDDWVAATIAIHPA